jgi:polyisoprenoid-binding protein YceI
MATYSVDTAHSEISFSVRHMVFAKVRGHFKTWTVSLAYDPQNPTKSTVEVDIDAASIDTREAQRDAHLRSPDFLDAEKFPKIIFKSKRIEPSGKGHYKVVGDLTIHGETHDVALDVEETGRGKDPWGNERVGFSAKGSIERSQWGLKWNQALETGGVLVADKIDIDIEAEAIQGK